MNRTFPEPVPDIALVASALADQSRAAMCAAMMDGRSWTAGELGRYCKLARSTTTQHLDRLAEAGIVSDVHQGRHRYLRLASDDVAALIEQLGIVAPMPVPTASSLRTARANEQMRAGRTCYKHLAGRLGVSLTDQLLQRELLRPDWQPTADGVALAARWGIRSLERMTATGCMDFTERRHHLAGKLGSAICTTFLDRGWLERINGTRAVRLTAAGQEALAAAGLTSPDTADSLSPGG
jgi:DNA-binding transcriptional ArsR family regulator